MPRLDELPVDFRDLLISFADEGCAFLLIGGWAMAVHGRARATDDLDVLVRADSENAQRVFRALAAFGAPLQAHEATPELFADDRYGYRFGLKPYCIEVLTSISGVTFAEATKAARVFLVEGRAVKVIGRDALVANKRAAGRPKDLDDVAWLEEHTRDDG